MDTVFVYGTLRTGGSNEFRMKGAYSLGKALIHARLYRVHEQFPGILLSEDAHDVLVGEVFTGVSAEHLQQLDLYEGCGEQVPREEQIYQRVRVRAQLIEGARAGQVVECWVWEYLGAVEEGSRMKSGDWLKGVG